MPRFYISVGGQKYTKLRAETSVTEHAYLELRAFWKEDDYYKNKSFSVYLSELLSRGIREVQRQFDDNKYDTNLGVLE